MAIVDTCTEHAIADAAPARIVSLSPAPAGWSVAFVDDDAVATVPVAAWAHVASRPHGHVCSCEAFHVLPAIAAPGGGLELVQAEHLVIPPGFRAERVDGQIRAVDMIVATAGRGRR